MNKRSYVSRASFIVPGILLALLALCGSAIAQPLPADFSARYSVKKYANTVAEMQLSLRTEGNEITYASHSEARGLAAILTNEEIDEISHLDISDKATPPQLRSYESRHRDRAKKNQQFVIEPGPQTNVSIRGSYNNKNFQLNTEKPIWDKLSFQLALARDAASVSKAGQKFSYRVIDKGRIDEYLFEFTGEAVVKIGERSYQTLVFKRQHGKRMTQMWLARELHYLPVKIEQYKNGDLNLSMSLDQIKL